MRIVSKSRSPAIILFIVIDLDTKKAYLKMRKKDDYRRYLSRRDNNKHRQFWIRLKEIEPETEDEQYYRRLVIEQRKETIRNKPNYKVEFYQGTKLTSTEFFSNLKQIAEYLGMSTWAVKRYRNIGLVTFYDGTSLRISQNFNCPENNFAQSNYRLK